MNNVDIERVDRDTAGNRCYTTNQNELHVSLRKHL
jgi:hypothetical protein